MFLLRNAFVMSSVLLVVGLQSCEKEDGVAVKGGEGSGAGGTTQSEQETTVSPLSIGGLTIGGKSIGDLTINGEGTKNTIETAIEATSESLSKSLGIFRQPADGYSGERNNVEYTNGGSGWGAATGQKAVYLTKRSTTLSVYYPYDSNCSDGKKSMSSCLSSEATDLCYEKGVSAKEGTAVTFNLGHAYARVEFVFSRAEAYDGSCSISGIGISDSNGKVIKSASLDLKSGQMSGQSYGSVSVNPGISGISTGNSTTVEVLMVPTTGLGTMTLRFTVDGSEKTATVTSISELKGGKSYKINVEISAAEKVETANCYLVAPTKSITVPVTVMGNGGATAGTVPSLIPSTSINPASVGIVWETAKGLITLGSLSNGEVTVTAGSSAGNAVIAAYSGASQTGTILWSWHIWVTDYDPETKTNGTTYTSTNAASVSYTWMDRNLGATGTSYSADNNILHYQWGRKDPFPYTTVVGSSTTVDVSSSYASIHTIDNSIQHPFTFIKGSSDWLSSPDGSLWGGSDLSSPDTKTIFDPCPVGWRVPAYNGSSTASSASPWSCITTSLYVAWGSSTGSFANNGATITSIESSFWPAAGYRYCSNGSLSNVGSNGYYWSASPGSSCGYSLYFYSSSVFPANNYYRANGFSVRCVQE
jgi:hypothetical protein